MKSPISQIEKVFTGLKLPREITNILDRLKSNPDDMSIWIEFAEKAGLIAEQYLQIEAFLQSIEIGRAVLIAALYLYKQEPNYDNNILLIHSQHKLGRLFFASDQLSLAENHFKIAYQLIKQLLGKEKNASLKAALAGILHYLGLTYLNLGEVDKCERYLERSIALYENLFRNHLVGRLELAHILETYSIFYRKKLNYAKSEKYLLRAIDLIKEEIQESPDEYKAKLLIRYKLNQGRLYREAGLLDLSEEATREALILVEKDIPIENNEDVLVCVFHELGNLYFRTSELDLSKDFQLKAEKLLEMRAQKLPSKNRKKQYADSLLQLAKLSANLRDMNNAENYFKKSIQIFKDTNLKAETALAYYSFGEYFEENVMFKEALNAYLSSYNLMKEIQPNKNLNSIKALCITTRKLCGYFFERNELREKLEYAISIIETFSDRKAIPSLMKRYIFLYELLLDIYLKADNSKYEELFNRIDSRINHQELITYLRGKFSFVRKDYETAKQYFISNIENDVLSYHKLMAFEQVFIAEEDYSNWLAQCDFILTYLYPEDLNAYISKETARDKLNEDTSKENSEIERICTENELWFDAAIRYYRFNKLDKSMFFLLKGLRLDKKDYISPNIFAALKTGNSKISIHHIIYLTARLLIDNDFDLSREIIKDLFVPGNKDDNEEYRSYLDQILRFEMMRQEVIPYVDLQTKSEVFIRDDKCNLINISVVSSSRIEIIENHYKSLLDELHKKEKEQNDLQIKIGSLYDDILQGFRKWDIEKDNILDDLIKNKSIELDEKKASISFRLGFGKDEIHKIESDLSELRKLYEENKELKKLNKDFNNLEKEVCFKFKEKHVLEDYLKQIDKIKKDFLKNLNSLQRALSWMLEERDTTILNRFLTLTNRIYRLLPYLPDAYIYELGGTDKKLIMLSDDKLYRPIKQGLMLYHFTKDKYINLADLFPVMLLLKEGLNSLLNKILIVYPYRWIKANDIDISRDHPDLPFLDTARMKFLKNNLDYITLEEMVGIYIEISNIINGEEKPADKWLHKICHVWKLTNAKFQFPFMQENDPLIGILENLTKKAGKNLSLEDIEKYLSFFSMPALEYGYEKIKINPFNLLLDVESFQVGAYGLESDRSEPIERNL
ncbi:MAG: tetratricopeptide repeat protein [Candidatus Coatesbacteria bacterium]|nr:tetratricopeptide repeat protein [Candidatus Coatesbacteria bacterium]